jgi:UDP-glucose 4-epimerase
VSVSIARFFNVYGPRHVRDGDNANVLGIFERQKMANQPLTITGTGEQRRDFTHVDDICEGLLAMAKRSWNGDVFNLGRSSNYSINEVASMFKPAEIQYLPSRPGEARETLANIDDSRSKLAWEPKRNLPDYIEEFLKGLGV